MKFAKSKIYKSIKQIQFRQKWSKIKAILGSKQERSRCWANHHIRIIHGKNDFAKISKNLDRYRSENNFVELSK